MASPASHSHTVAEDSPISPAVVRLQRGVRRYLEQRRAVRLLATLFFLSEEDHGRLCWQWRPLPPPHLPHGRLPKAETMCSARDVQQAAGLLSIAVDAAATYEQRLRIENLTRTLLFDELRQTSTVFRQASPEARHLLRQRHPGLRHVVLLPSKDWAQLKEEVNSVMAQEEEEQAKEEVAAAEALHSTAEQKEEKSESAESEAEAARRAASTAVRELEASLGPALTLWLLDYTVHTPKGKASPTPNSQHGGEVTHFTSVSVNTSEKTEEEDGEVADWMRTRPLRSAFVKVLEYCNSTAGTRSHSGSAPSHEEMNPVAEHHANGAEKGPNRGENEASFSSPLLLVSDVPPLPPPTKPLLAAGVTPSGPVEASTAGSIGLSSAPTSAHSTAPLPPAAPPSSPSSPSSAPLRRTESAADDSPAHATLRPIPLQDGDTNESPADNDAPSDCERLKEPSKEYASPTGVEVDGLHQKNEEEKHHPVEGDTLTKSDADTDDSVADEEEEDEEVRKAADVAYYTEQHERHAKLRAALRERLGMEKEEAEVGPEEAHSPSEEGTHDRHSTVADETNQRKGLQTFFPQESAINALLEAAGGAFGDVADVQCPFLGPSSHSAPHSTHTRQTSSNINSPYHTDCAAHLPPKPACQQSAYCAVCELRGVHIDSTACTPSSVSAGVLSQEEEEIEDVLYPCRRCGLAVHTACGVVDDGCRVHGTVPAVYCSLYCSKP